MEFSHAMQLIYTTVKVNPDDKVGGSGELMLVADHRKLSSCRETSGVNWTEGKRAKLSQGHWKIDYNFVHPDWVDDKFWLWSEVFPARLAKRPDRLLPLCHQLRIDEEHLPSVLVISYFRLHQWLACYLLLTYDRLYLTSVT